MAAARRVRNGLGFICRTCQHQRQASSLRPFHTSLVRATETDRTQQSLRDLSNQIHQNPTRGSQRGASPDSSPYRYGKLLDYLDNPNQDALLDDAFSPNLDASQEAKPHQLHVFAHKHNTHISFVQPPTLASQMLSRRTSGTSSGAADQKKKVDLVMSLSTGNIGFRKAGRGSYDAAYQLAAFTMKQIAERGLLRDIKKLEVVLRGFGAGREAVTKAILGAEGRHIRNKITAVVDATRLKRGGVRSPKPRRLG